MKRERWVTLAKAIEMSEYSEKEIRDLLRRHIVQSRRDPLPYGYGHQLMVNLGELLAYAPQVPVEIAPKVMDAFQVIFATCPACGANLQYQLGNWTCRCGYAAADRIVYKMSKKGAEA